MLFINAFEKVFTLVLSQIRDITSKDLYIFKNSHSRKKRVKFPIQILLLSRKNFGSPGSQNPKNLHPWCGLIVLGGGHYTYFCFCPWGDTNFNFQRAISPELLDFNSITSKYFALKYKTVWVYWSQ